MGGDQTSRFQTSGRINRTKVLFLLGVPGLGNECPEAGYETGETTKSHNEVEKEWGRRWPDEIE